MSRRPLLALVVVALFVLAGCSTVPGVPSTPGSPGATTPGAGTTTGGPTTDTSSTPGTTTDGGPTPGPPPNGTLAVHFVNVGQSTSVLVVGPTGVTMLVDTGPWQDDGRDVFAYLRRANVTRIDVLVTSHADADHIGGHAAVIEHFETEGRGVGAVYDPGIASDSQTYARYLDAVERHDVPLFVTQAGDSIPIEGANVTVLAPPASGLGDDRNENSIVLLVTFGDAVFLFTGDAESEGEAYLVETYGDGLRATVLKAGHHGSRTSTSPALLDAVRPRLVAISSAYDSPFDHPHEEVLSRLAARDVPAVWTGVHGDVVVRTDGANVTVLSQRDVPTAPTALRSADPVKPGLADPVRVLMAFDAADDGPPATTTTESPDSPNGTDGDGSLRLVTVHADAVGNDDENLTDEYLVFENAGDVALDLSGWTVADAAGHVYTFPSGTSFAAGETLTLHTGTGTDTDAHRYWGAASAVWNNGGDTVIVRDDDGAVVLEVTYGGG